MKTVNAVIFDTDGLMLDTEKLYETFWEKALQYYDYQPTNDLLLNLRSLSKDLVDKLLRENFSVAVIMIKIETTYLLVWERLRIDLPQQLIMREQICK